MLREIVSLSFLFLIYRTNEAQQNQNWDLNWPCQAHIKELAETDSKMVSCAIENSSPPRVCTNCYNQYISLKQKEFQTHHLDDVYSVDGTPCSTVIYDNYLESYATEMSNSISQNIWKSSKCQYCLDIVWDFPKMNSTAELNTRTLKFKTFLLGWRSCVEFLALNDTQICSECSEKFDSLFDYYWKIYTDKDVDFCIDIESVMNDTMHMWQNVWKCADDPRIVVDRRLDVLVTAFSTILLVLIIVFFYGGSYIQTENAQRNLVQYSQQPNRDQRSRILSSSTLDSCEPSTSSISVCHNNG